MADKSLQDSSSRPERKIVLVGKTGSKKSSLANTLFGEEVFFPDGSPSSGTAECKSTTKVVMNTRLTLIDTPGLVDTGRSEKELMIDIIKSIVKCSPGIHVFLILLKVEKYTKNEEEVVDKIFEYFSEEVLKYSVIVFTHGDQLKEGTTIQQFVDCNQKLKDLVRKCEGGCHVFDSKHWKTNNDPEEYRRNSYQLKQLLITVEKLVRNNKGEMYTNEMLQKVEEMIVKHEEKIRQTESNLSDEEIREKAIGMTYLVLLKTLWHFGAQQLYKAFFGVVGFVSAVPAAITTATGSLFGAVTGFFKGMFKKWFG